MTMIEHGAFASARISKTGRLTRRGKGRLINRESLDGRTATARGYDDLVTAIHADLGGVDQISSMEKSLVESYVGASVVIGHLNAKILSGAAIDSALVAMYSAATSTQVRCAAKLGIARRAKAVETVELYLAKKEVAAA